MRTNLINELTNKLTDANVGTFNIPESILRQDLEFHSEVFAAIKFLPIRTENLFASKEMEYIGLSKQFDKVNIGAEIPSYRLEVTRNKDGKLVKVNCIRLDKR